MLNYSQKYFKYKTKYLELKKSYNGGGDGDNLDKFEINNCLYMNDLYELLKINSKLNISLNNEIIKFKEHIQLLCTKYNIDYSPNFNITLLKELLTNIIHYDISEQDVKRLEDCVKLTDYNDNLFEELKGIDKSKKRLIIPKTVRTINQIFTPNLENIIFQDGNEKLTKLSDNVFENNTNLTILNLSKTKLKEIGKKCFAYCGLTEIIFPTTLIKLSDNVFNNNTNLTILDLSKTELTEIGKKCFTNCGLTEINLPITLTKLSDYIFSNNTNLTNLDLSETELTKIGEGCFKSCSLTEIKLPNHLITLGNMAFKLNNLITIELSNLSSLTEIGAECFAECNLTTIKLPNNLTKLKYQAFAFNSNLKTIDLSKLSLLTEIESKCFNSCGLTEVKLPPTLKKIGSDIFLNNENLTKIICSHNLINTFNKEHSNAEIITY